MTEEPRPLPEDHPVVELMQALSDLARTVSEETDLPDADTEDTDGHEDR